MLVRVSPLFRTRIRCWKQVLENMPSATFSSSRSYVRRSRRKGGNRLPLPSRTQSGKSFCSWTRLYPLSCLAREACLLTDCFCFSSTEILVLFDVHALIALWQYRWIGIDYLTYEYIIRKSFCVPFFKRIFLWLSSCTWEWSHSHDPPCVMQRFQLVFSGSVIWLSILPSMLWMQIT